MRKIETLQSYLERLERNLEKLMANGNGRNDNRADIKKAEQTIQSVQQQLQLQYAEVRVAHASERETESFRRVVLVVEREYEIAIMECETAACVLLCCLCALFGVFRVIFKCE